MSDPRLAAGLRAAARKPCLLCGRPPFVGAAYAPDAASQRRVCAPPRALLAEHLQPDRERLLALPAVRRLGVLRIESRAVVGEYDQIVAGLNRIDAAKAEAIALARPGWSALVAALDQERINLPARFTAIRARLDAMVEPVTAAQADALRAVNNARASSASAATHTLRAQRDPIVAEIALQLSGLLDRAIGCQEALETAANVVRQYLYGVAQDASDVNTLADEAARVVPAEPAV